jgi:hypothetical protein
MRAVIIAMLAATQVGPATTPASDVKEIRYATTACYGSCPVYSLDVQPDGTGTFRGFADVAAMGTHDFVASPEAYRRFAARLAPYRPVQGEVIHRENCGEPLIRHHPSVDVRWRNAAGGHEHLSHYLGCDRAMYPGLAAALMAAPGELPIAALIGRR